MLPANLINALQVLSRSEKPLIKVDTPNPSLTIEPGQQIQGTVQSQLSPGLFKVIVAGQSMQMRLPGNVRSGDVLDLQVIANSPRLTFSVITSAAPISTHEQIGAMARLLADLAQQPIENPVARQLGKTAIWQTPLTAPDSKQLATALRDALGNSGLFYESHQAQWVRGERSTAQLLVEPQNQLVGNPALPPGASPATQASEPNIPALPTAQNSPVTDAQSLPVSKELLPLVQQQLHALETHQLTWIGQVWPGQDMQWEIQGQPEHQSSQQDARQWSTEVELALPRLGDVYVRLVFSASGLALTMHVADSATVALFNRSMEGLQAALADADIPLTAVAVAKT